MQLWNYSLAQHLTQSLIRWSTRRGFLDWLPDTPLLLPCCIDDAKLRLFSARKAQLKFYLVNNSQSCRTDADAHWSEQRREGMKSGKSGTGYLRLSWQILLTNIDTEIEFTAVTLLPFPGGVTISEEHRTTNLPKTQTWPVTLTVLMLTKHEA